MDRLKALGLVAAVALLAPLAAASQPATDSPPRELQISVRTDGAETVQRVQVLEGRRAVIYTGRSAPTRERRYIRTPAGVIPQQVVIVQDETSGFAVVPRLAGDHVVLELGDATVRTRLGEWIRLDSQALSLKVDEVRD